MTDLKLRKLPDRAPVKMTIIVTPELADALAAYAVLYREAYDREEPVAELVPAMLTAFLESDRAFQKARRDRA
ncbi:MAG TPA: DUF2274 domain-containing protein [Sphingobium sp.]|uniref:DUF2274 domain-containing protein n=1 Tax=Sphingobium sp. TaxID=1912891 RepID=UPI002ED165D6